MGTVLPNLIAKNTSKIENTDKYWYATEHSNLHKPHSLFMFTSFRKISHLFTDQSESSWSYHNSLLFIYSLTKLFTLVHKCLFIKYSYKSTQTHSFLSKQQISFVIHYSLLETAFTLDILRYWHKLPVYWTILLWRISFLETPLHI